MPDRELLLSIVIPTRNRRAVLIDSLRQILDCSRDEFELIVHDNSDTPALSESELNDPRLRYVHVPEPLNMHGNFDRAVALARGLYVISIGDDDTVLVEPSLRMLENARDAGLDAIVSTRESYNWPGIRHRFWGDIGGLHEAGRPSVRTMTLLNPAKEREWVLRSGAVQGMRDLPRLYQGYVHRDALARLYARCGTYFPGASPDMANSIALASCVNRFGSFPEATMISGHSPKSGGGAGAGGIHHGRIEDQAHLPAETRAGWNNAIPRFWSGPTIYAQAALDACHKFGLAYAGTFNFPALYATCLLFEPKIYRPEILRAMRTGPGDFSHTLAATLAQLPVLFAHRLANFARNLAYYRFVAGGRQRYETISELARALRSKWQPAR